MKQLCVIIHPSAYQMNELTSTMAIAALDNKQEPCTSHRYNNLEMGAYNQELISNERHTLWAMIDGEPSNKEDLKQELAKLGFTFTTDKAAELIIAAYDAWEEGFLQRLSGSFALFLFDEQKGHLIIARDRMGQKPLYWTIQGQHFLASTQIKTLLATGVVPQTPSLDALSSYLYFGFIPQDLTPIKGVNKLLPCHYLKVDLNRRWQIQQYWSLSDAYEKKLSLSEESAYNDFGSLLEKANLTYTKKEEPLGLLLSNSLGAASIAWFASHESKRESLIAQNAYFPSSFNQNDLSHQGAKHLSLKHKTITVTAEEIFNELVSTIWALDEPIADPKICLTNALSKEAEKEHLSLCLADLGFEEALAGSPRPFFSPDEAFQPFVNKLAALPSTLRDYLLLPLSKLFGFGSQYRILRNIDINQHQINYLDRIALFKGRNRKKVSPALFPYFDPETFTQRFHRLIDVSGTISPCLYFDAKTLLPDSTLLQYERLFTARGISIAAPFTDHSLVEFLAALPDNIKYKENKPAIMLETLMHKLCGECSPFEPESPNAFFDSFKQDPLFKEHFALLKKARVVEEGYISLKWIKQQLNYPHPIPYTFRELWAILVFEIWFRLYISSPIGSLNPHISTRELLG